MNTLLLRAKTLTLLGSLAAQQPVAEPAGGSEQATVPAAVLAAEFAPTVDELFADVRFLADDALQGRLSGSEHAAIAALYIATQMRKLGLEPAGDDGGCEQRFERVEMVGVADASAGRVQLERRTLTCRNVLAWLPGADPRLRDEYVLIGAHFDHLGRRGDAIYNGADDNASGVAGLLGVARALVLGEQAPRRSVLFVAFGAEEQGLRGAQHFVRHPPRSLQQCVTMVNLDMIGRPRLLDKKQLALPKRLVGIPDAPAVGVIGTSQSRELAAIARAVFAADELPLFAPEDFGVLRSVIEKQADGRSDHAPFAQRGIPHLFFSTSENDDYHQPTDTVDKVDPQTLWRIARCVYRAVLAIDARDPRPGFERAPQGDGRRDKR